MRNAVLCGDALALLQQMPPESVQICVTSPPYWGLRDYGVAGQMGLEATPEAYVARMVEVFRGVWRVLRPDGTLWLNLGDSYFADSPIRDKSEDRFTDISPVKRSAGGARRGCASVEGLKRKDLIGIPWRVAFALQTDGWWLRSDIIWHKPNAMPESMQDRPTRSHEYIFLLSKSERYYYDSVAIREPAKYPDGPHSPQSIKSPYGQGFTRRSDKQRGHSKRHAGFNDRWDQMSKEQQQALGANKRDVWTVATHHFPEAHFATFPPALIEPCILAGSHPGDIVLDPFGGSGTVGVVCRRHSRDYLLLELNPTYCEMAERRISHEIQPHLWTHTVTEEAS